MPYRCILKGSKRKIIINLDSNLPKRINEYKRQHLSVQAIYSLIGSFSALELFTVYLIARTASKCSGIQVFFQCTTALMTLFLIFFFSALLFRPSTAIKQTILVTESIISYGTIIGSIMHFTFSQLVCVEKNSPQYVDYSGYASRFVLYMLPMTLSCLYGGSRNSDFIAVVLSIYGFFNLVVLWAKDSQEAAIFLTIISFVTTILSMEQHRQFNEIFKSNEILAQTVEIKQQISTDEKTKELRRVILSMTHDIKTPLTAFVSGIEYIAALSDDIMKDFFEMKRMLSFQSPYYSSIMNKMQQIKTNAVTISNINVFMTMNLNRCVDYTKALKGLKLRQKYESFSLKEAFMSSIACLYDAAEIGSNKAIVRTEFKVLPPKLTEYSHIISDKQWLQENLLCLLSNAVGSSTHNKGDKNAMITISVSLVSTEKEWRKLMNQITLPDPSLAASTTDSSLYSFSSCNPDYCYSLAPTVVSPMEVTPVLTSPLPSLDDDRVVGYPLDQSNSNATFMKVAMLSRVAAKKVASIVLDRNNAGNLSLSNMVAASYEGMNNAKAAEDSKANAYNNKHQTARYLHGCGAVSPTDFVPMLHIEVQDMGGGLAGRQQNAESLFQGCCACSGGCDDSKSGHSHGKDSTTDKSSHGDHHHSEREDNNSNCSETVKPAGGAGLGLFTLARRVDALNGHYGVAQRRDGGEGCLFWFQIPYKPDFSHGRDNKPNSCQIESFDSDSNGSIIFPLTKLPSNPFDFADDFFNEVSDPISNSAIYRSDDSATDSSSFHIPSQSSDASTTIFPPSPPRKRLGLKILLVDDSILIHKTTSQLLRRHGHHVDQAMNGKEALESARNKLHRLSTVAGVDPDSPYQVVIMDLQMPVMDGLESIRHIRQEEQLQEQQERNTEESKFGPPAKFRRHFIVACSANSDDSTMQEALRAGADAFVGKPFVLSRFYELYDAAEK